MRPVGLPRFLLLVAAWLFVMLGLWWLATPVLGWPVARLCEVATRIAFGDLVQGVEQNDNLITFVTSLAPGNASVAGAGRAVLAVPSNYRLFSFGLPMLWALILAAREPH